MSSAHSGLIIRLRAVMLGLLLSGLICALTPINNIYNQATPLGGGHFPLAPFYILLLTTILAGTIARILPKARLITGQELLDWVAEVEETLIPDEVRQ